jgi:hypothetical protein
MNWSLVRALSRCSKNNTNGHAVLLKVLEYFDGIMFLTTNRVETIDTAFKSRIHLSLYYPVLSMDARRSIWKSFIARCSGPFTSEWLDDEFLNKLASHDINGRQIKNVLRVAYSIAANDNRDLRPEDIVKVLEACESFESDFRNVMSNTLPILRLFHKTKVYGRVCLTGVTEMVGKTEWLSRILMFTGSVVAIKWVWVGVKSFTRWWRFHGTSG